MSLRKFVGVESLLSFAQYYAKLWGYERQSLQQQCVAIDSCEIGSREANYMRNLPLHHSQQEAEIMEEYSDFELFLRPTADFIAPLLARGSAIKVLYPQWLADAVKQQHQEAANLYE